MVKCRKGNDPTIVSFSHDGKTIAIGMTQVSFTRPMQVSPHNSLLVKPSTVFFIGLALVMLALWMFFIPDWTTFVHSWRVSLFASLFLSATVAYLIFKAKQIDLTLPFSRDEKRFILLPLLLFTVWSFASIAWGSSWKSTIHHTSIWAAYLTFYCVTRYLLDQKGQYKRFIYVLVGVLLAYSVPAIAGFVALNIFGGANKLGVGFARFGEQVLTLLPLLLVGVVRLKGRSFVLGVMAVTTLWLFMFSTFGRTNYGLFAIGIAAIGAAIFLFRRYRLYRIKFAITAAALIVMTVVMISLPMLSVSQTPPDSHRFTNNESISASNNFRKLMISLSVEMIATHPIIGVGADNFGFEVNRYREIYSLQNPDHPNLAAAENEIPERAHNEFLQIFAELGLVGAAIFAWFLTGIGVMAFKSLKELPTRSIHAYAAMVGIGLFIASSIVTSYSFRLIQNGFVFFFVLAVAAKLLLKDKVDEREEIVLSVSRFRIAAVASLTACLLLAAHSSSNVASVIITQKANGIRNIDEALKLYETASFIDDENPFVRNSLGHRLLHEGRYAEAAVNLSRSIDMGLATSTSFSYLATAHSLAGDNITAEETMRRALVYYPRSPFILTRYAALLKENGKEQHSVEILAKANLISPKASRTWFSFISEGAKTTSDKAVFDKELMPVMDLQPSSAIYAVATERLIKFPEERRFSMLNIGTRHETPAQPLSP